MFADIVRTEHPCDFAILVSGTVRSNSIIPKGPLTMRMITQIIPLWPSPDRIVVVQISGKTLRDALENGVSSWPKYDGRFPVISGLRFEFDPS
jgi:5'-nucleotidase